MGVEQLPKLSDDLAQINKELAQVESEETRLRVEVTRIQRELTEAENEVRRIADSINELKAQEETSKKRISELAAALSAAKEICAEEQQKTSSLCNEIQRLRKRRQSLIVEYVSKLPHEESKHTFTSRQICKQCRDVLRDRI